MSFYLNKPKFLEGLVLFLIPAVVCKHSAHTNIASASLDQWDFVSVSSLALLIYLVIHWFAFNRGLCTSQDSSCHVLKASCSWLLVRLSMVLWKTKLFLIFGLLWFYFCCSKLPSNSHCHELYLSALTPVAAVCTTL